jgi:hypothetical protein
MVPEKAKPYTKDSRTNSINTKKPDHHTIIKTVRESILCTNQLTISTVSVLGGWVTAVKIYAVQLSGGKQKFFKKSLYDNKNHAELHKENFQGRTQVSGDRVQHFVCKQGVIKLNGNPSVIRNNLQKRTKVKKALATRRADKMENTAAATVKPLYEQMAEISTKTTLVVAKWKRAHCSLL